MTLKVWKDTRDESTVYLDLDPRSGDSVALLVRDAAGRQKACLLYVKKEGIERLPSINERLGFKVTHGGRIALLSDPIIKELKKARGEQVCSLCGCGQ